MKNKIKKLIKNILTVSFKEKDIVLNIKNKFDCNVRSFIYGLKKVFVNSIYCHATPGTIETTILTLSDFKKDGRLLNLGGGTGQVADIFKEIGFDVFNVDIDIKESEQNEKNIKIDLNQIVDYSFEPNFFNVVVCQEIIEHIENPWKLFRDVKKLISKDGIFILSTPNTQSIFSRFKFLFTGFFHWFSPKLTDFHINPLFDWEIKLIADKNNFEVIDVKGSGDYFFKKKNSFSRLLRKNEGLIYIFKNK